MKTNDSTKVQPTALALYCPFGSDSVLSSYPGSVTNVLDHPVVDSMRRCAKAGSPAFALVDMYDGSTWLLKVMPLNPEQVVSENKWKCDLKDPRTLSGFICSVSEVVPDHAICLGLEGHGAGFLPAIDRHRQSWLGMSGGGGRAWKIGADSGVLTDEDGSPVLPIGVPDIPGGNPLLPVNFDFMSTFDFGKALEHATKETGRKISVVFFDNCFNMSAELLHTVAPYAHAAGGFCNYNFFTAGQAYALAFQKLADAGRATPLELAQWLTDANHAILADKGGHPTVGGALALERMAGIKEGLHVLSGKLLDAMASSPKRADTVASIQKAIYEAQQYDTMFPMELEAPDQLTDLYSLASQLAGPIMAGYPSVQDAAATLASMLKGIKLYGDKGMPWMADEPHEGQYVWDFTEPTLAMNIFLPDPLREGQWDWRSNYYIDTDPQPFPLLDANGDPQKDANGQAIMLPPAQTGVIDFLKGNNWIEFLKEYHRETKFKSFFVGKIPQLPVHNAEYRPPVVKGEEPPTCRMPRRPWPLTRVAKEMLATVREQAAKLTK